jgi:hypothetical protein
MYVEMGGMENARKFFVLVNEILLNMLTYLGGCMHVEENLLLFHQFFFGLAEQKNIKV